SRPGPFGVTLRKAIVMPGTGGRRETWRQGRTGHDSSRTTGLGGGKRDTMPGRQRPALYPA
ncbi:MAG: hypothetical protein WBM52_11855, partial [Thiogranum sp.]